MKYVAPSVTETAFNCPHCDALAKQFWCMGHADPLSKNSMPNVIFPDSAGDWSYKRVDDVNLRANLRKWAKEMMTGRPFLESTSTYADYVLHNFWVSRCYNCNDISLWIHDRLIYPVVGAAPPVNPDTPDDIKRDYLEASSILSLSPRGAAALLRLAIQKLCKHVGQPGKNINSDIGSLVASGLDHRVQKALDAMRVIGNDAVHPGQLDLRDNQATAETLFKLFNLIVEKMISEPKHVDDVYNSLPEDKLKQIEQRDERTTKLIEN